MNKSQPLWSRDKALGRGFESTLCLGRFSSLIIPITALPNLVELMHAKNTSVAIFHQPSRDDIK